MMYSRLGRTRPREPRTTSATGNRECSTHQFRAFTLLELVIALAIIVIVSTVFAVVVFDDPEERAFLNVIQQVETLFFESKSYASGNHDDCVVVFDDNSMQSIASSDNRIIDKVAIPEDMTVSFQSLLFNEWSNLEQMECYFRKSGLNTPLVLRFVNKTGYCQLELNALTGKASRTIEFR